MLTLHEEIHCFRPQHNTRPVVQLRVNDVLVTPDLDREIYALMEESDFNGIPGLLRIVKERGNVNKISLDVLFRILGYLQTTGDIPKNFTELREKVEEILKAKKKIAGVR